jgi:uncharacterized protein YcaQ
MIKLTKEEARRFMLKRQGLLGEKIFLEKSGILEFIQKMGCIQFDPVDVCGTSPELVLQSRIQNFSKEMLGDLLYKERQLLDFFDKNLSILPVQDLPMFIHKYEGVSYAEFMAKRKDPAIESMIRIVRDYLVENEFVFAKDLRAFESGNLTWEWGANSSVARAALETLYIQGELIIHHKSGRQKAYALAKDYLPAEILTAENPFENEKDYHEKLILRRLGSVGLLWNKRSDVWLGIENFKTKERNLAFGQLIKDEKILSVELEGSSEVFYLLTEEKSLLTDLSVMTERVEFLAPLDNMLWDRNLIREIFDFDYKWEIYTPKEKRKYGAYVLPVLYKDQLVGRVEIERKIKEKLLFVKNL